MDMNTLAKANQLVDIMGIHSRELEKLKGIDRDANVIIISTNHELYDEIKHQIQDYDSRNPGNTASVELGGGAKDCMMNALLDYENNALKETNSKLEAL